MKLEKIAQSTTTKTVFASLAATALIGTMLIFPSFGYIVKEFEQDKKWQKYIRKVFRKLEKQKLITIKENPSGEITIEITEQGKLKALTFKIDSMKLKKQKWDKIWRVVIFDIPENKKKERDLFRSHLNRLEFYKLQKSVFVTPHPCKEEIDFLKHNLDISNHITFIESYSIDSQNLLRNHFQV